MGNNREFDVSGILQSVLLIVGGGKLTTIEDPTLSAYSYQLLPLTTNQKKGDNREFDGYPWFNIR